MTIELAFFISFIALLFNAISIWMMGRMTQGQRAIIKRVWNRIEYLEVSMSCHKLISLPWEIEDLDDHINEMKYCKRDGNVIYLNEEE